MKYCSTRGGVKGVPFRQALFSGYALDGGLFVPEIVPKLSPDTISEWVKAKLSYPKIVYEIVRRFVSEEELPNDALAKCIENAYNTGKFDTLSVVGMKNCNTRRTEEGFTVAELFHGQTQSFKDYALSLVGQLMQYFLNKHNEKLIVLVGTSGDTGSAAIKSVEGLEGIDIIVLYPDGKISAVQELQMTSSLAKNVHVFAVEGTSDDLDVPIRQCFPGEGICSINSINWARIMIQIAHFVYLYIHEGGEALDIFLPTGAAGNLVSGVICNLMGFPIKFFPATNENDNVHAFLNKGQLRLGGTIISTPANAMDIRYPYNLERLIYLLSNSPELTAKYMTICESDSENVADIEKSLLDKIKTIVPECQLVETKHIHETIQWVWKTQKYMICPHTATAFYHLDKSGKLTKNKAVVVSTASPQKFSDVVSAAGISSAEWKGDELWTKLKAGPQVEPNRSMKMQNQSDWLKILQEEISKIRSTH